MNSKMKVLQVIPRLDYGGAETGCYDLAHFLPEQGCRSFIITSGGELLKFINKQKVKVFKLPVQSKNPILILFNAIIISLIILIYNINIVHGNDLRINLTWSFSTIFTTSKYVWHQRQVLSRSMKWRAIRYLSNHIISISNYVHNSLPVNISNDFESCIANPFDISHLHKKKHSRNKINSIYGISDSTILVGYVGRLVPCKHIDDILHALSNIINSGSIKNIHLLIVGSGDSSYIKKINSIIELKKLENHVTMTGFIENPSLALSSLDLLVASSYNEPFGRVLIESMLQKTIVLAQKSGGHVEIISNGINGFLYTNTSADSISNMIVKIISNKFDNEKVTEVAYNAAVKNYSVASHANRVISVYNNLLE